VLRQWEKEAGWSYEINGGRDGVYAVVTVR
jgi:hypothetical protein